MYLIWFREWGGIDIRVEVTEHVIGRTAILLAVFGNSVAVCRSTLVRSVHHPSSEAHSLVR